MDVALPRRPRTKRTPAPSTEPVQVVRVAPDPADWAKWKNLLGKRRPIRLPGLAPDDTGSSPLLWGAADCLDADGRALIGELHRGLQKGKLTTPARRLQAWLNEALTSPTVQTALEAIA